MESKFLLLYLVLVILHLSSTTSAVSTPISAATEVLSDSGYFSMAITLQITSTALNLSDSPTLTVFAPSDLAFSRSGQPSLLDLQYQISPVRLSGETLQDLPYGAKIPSLRLDAPLIVTASSDSFGEVLINDVSVQDSAVFDDGYVVIYGTDEFFKPLSQISLSIIPAPEPSRDSSPNSPIGSNPNSPLASSPNWPTDARFSSPNGSSSDSPTVSSSSFPVPSGSEFPTGPSPNLPLDSIPKFVTHSSPIFPSSLSGFDMDINVFEQASCLLMAKGYMIMGTFLDSQLESSANRTRLTIFAPLDEAITESVTNFSSYSMIFRGHVLHKLLSWKDLRKVGDGAILHSALSGFMINVSWSGDILLLNGVPVIFPDLYVSDWIVVHGINRMIISQSKQDPMGESFSELDGGDEDDHQDSPDIGEYGAQ